MPLCIYMKIVESSVSAWEGKCVQRAAYGVIREKPSLKQIQAVLSQVELPNRNVNMSQIMFSFINSLQNIRITT